MKYFYKNNYSGNLFLLVSQIVFLVCGYGIQVVITRFLTPEEYGLWGVLTAVLVWFELTIISGFPKGVTKFIAESKGGGQDEIYFRSYFIQLIIGLLLGGLFFLLADPLSRFWDNDQLSILFYISALDIPIYGLYFENMAVLNGRQKYGRMFIAQGIYSLSKLILIIYLVVDGYGLVGAAWGNVLASIVAFLLSQYLVGLPILPKQRNFDIQKLISFCIPSTVFVLLFAFMQRLDFLLLNSMTNASKVIGFYWAAQLLAKVPYYLIEGTSKKMFSEISECYGARDWDSAAKSLQENFHLTILLIGLIGSVTIGSAKDILLLLFPVEYGEAADILVILIAANSLTALVYLFAQVLFSIGEEKKAMIRVLIMVIISIILCWFFISWQGAIGAAIAALLGFLSGVVLLYSSVRGLIKVNLSGSIIPKILITCVLTIVIGRFLHVDSKIGIFVKLVFVSSFYFISLFFLKEPLMQYLSRKVHDFLRQTEK